GEISDQTLSGARLTRAELEREVRQLGKRWALAGDDLEVVVYSREMARFARVIDQVAVLSDELELRPRIVVEFPRLAVTIKAASTVGELIFAARLEQWLREHH